MAKKFVRGVTGIDDIEKFDKTLTNVNDLLSDGQHTYVHTKKGKVESYYNLTDNIQTITSSQNTITVQKDENGAVKLDTNPQKVLEHENLAVGDGLSVSHSGNNSTIKIEPTLKEPGLNLDTLNSGLIHGTGFVSSVLQQPTGTETTFITLKISNNSKFQLSIRPSVVQSDKAIIEYRFITRNQSTNWMMAPSSMNEITSLLASKQNTITNNESIAVSGTGLRQLYTQKQTYTVTGGLLKTHIKSISSNSSINLPEEEFNFIAKIDKGVPSVNFTLNEHDTNKFATIIETYGQDNTVRISGFVFTLDGSNLTVSATNNTNQNYVITFSDII